MTTQMISTTIYSERYRRILAKKNQMAFAEKAHEYPCCDIPTIKMCSNCMGDFPCLLRRPISIITGKSKPRRSIADLYIPLAMGMMESMSPELNYHLKSDLMRPVRRLFREKPYKECILPGCEETTNHNGGYCCAEHCREHRRRHRLSIK